MPAALTATTERAASTGRDFAARRRLALLLMTMSGFAGLGYQIVWTQQISLYLGHETAGVLAVVAAFFGGIACGALLLGSRVDRSAQPQRWYAACEIIMCSWSLVLAALLAPAGNWMTTLIGVLPSAGWQWTITFTGTFVLLLPATAAMGVTLPAMERLTAAGEGSRASISILYAANTAGAVLGAIATSFWLIPQWGLLRSVVVCAALNVLCALIALSIRCDARRAAPVRRTTAAAPLLSLALTGLLGIGYEVLVVRALSQVAQNTIFTFAILLAVYLIGTSAGAHLYFRWLRHHDVARTRNRLAHSLAAACLLGICLLQTAPLIKSSVTALLGASMRSELTAEVTIATAAFLLPTMFMGALFSHLTIAARTAGASVGLAIGVNTLGAALAPLLFGVWLLPAVGVKMALLAIVAGYCFLVPWHSSRSLATATVVAATIVVAIWLPPLTMISIPDGGRLVRYIEGSMASVSVIEDAQGVARLHINNRQQEGSSATQFADARQALLPILLHPAPRRVLMLGLGTGMTAHAAAQDPSLQVDAVELLPEVIAASKHFQQIAWGDTPSRLHVLAADARRYTRASTDRYDVIVADNFHPARSGSGSLYTVEHFRAIRARLNDDGLFCQWLPLHQLDLGTLRSIVQSFLSVYPDGHALLATNSLQTPVIGLIAGRTQRRFTIDSVDARIQSATMPRLDAFGLSDAYAVLGSMIAGPHSLRQFARNADLNTDDHPVVTYRAPRITYQPDSTPAERLALLLQEVSITTTEVLTQVTQPQVTNEATRLTAYWTARQQFIDIGLTARPLSDVRGMLAQVGDPLLRVLNISPDFRPAYDPLLQMGIALDRIDPRAASDLLQRLQLLQPARPEAAEALSLISAN